MAFMQSILDPVFSPLLTLPSVVGILLIAFFITLLSTLAFKYFTDQSAMKSIKEEIKGYQAEMKKHRNDPDKMMKINKKSMDATMRSFKHTLKPTLITILPFIIIFGWLNAHFTYDPLVQDTDFFVAAQFDKGATGEIKINVPEAFTLYNEAVQPVTETVEWKMKAPAGEYVLSYSYDLPEFKQPIRINADPRDRLYENPVLTKAELLEQGLAKKDPLESITIGNRKIRPFGDISLFGWHPGWFFTYFIFAIAFSIILRKVLKVY
jgi:uncharacterized membrane protein (DUF106 family)